MERGGALKRRPSVQGYVASAMGGREGGREREKESGTPSALSEPRDHWLCAVGLCGCTRILLRVMERFVFCFVLLCAVALLIERNTQVVAGLTTGLSHPCCL